MIVYKIVDSTSWHASKEKGVFDGSADDQQDGFIHLSTATQLSGTLAKHFQGQGELLLIGFDDKAINDGLRWEVSRGGARFPHYYGALPTNRAVSEHLIALAPGGQHILPEDLA